eukprot:7798622-Heterocapsa_arctica.AAC.1
MSPPSLLKRLSLVRPQRTLGLKPPLDQDVAQERREDVDEAGVEVGDLVDGVFGAHLSHRVEREPRPHRLAVQALPDAVNSQ